MPAGRPGSYIRLPALPGGKVFASRRALAFCLYLPVNLAPLMIFLPVGQACPGQSGSK